MSIETMTSICQWKRAGGPRRRSRGPEGHAPLFDPVNDACYFVAADGRVQPVAGAHPNPDLTIETPFDLWMDIVTRKACGAQMLMENKYKVRGDLALMMQLFKKEDKPA